MRQSLRVLEGTGGIKTLDDGDKDNIRQTIDEEVLKGTAIEFRSTAVQAVGDGGPLRGPRRARAARARRRRSRSRCSQARAGT